MLYKIFKWLFYFTVQGYFRKISIRGKEHIPRSGPIIFVANHNSAFMDPIVLAVCIHRSLYFLARGESFKSYWVSKFFGWLHMIPIFRPEVAPDKVYKNKSAFELCYTHLKKGKALLIFPEGFSETVRKLRPLKTGTARIALGAEHRYNFGLDVKIVPVGINYSNPHYFRSDVFLNFGEPIVVSEYTKDFEENEKNAVALLTDTIAKDLEKLLVIIHDEKLNRVIDSFDKLYRTEIQSESLSEHQPIQNFRTHKEFAKMVAQYQNKYPKKLVAIELKLDRYLDQLQQLQIRDSQIVPKRKRFGPMGRLLYFLLGLPLCLYGYLVNIVPYTLARYLSKRIRVRRDFIGSMKIAFGMFVFLFFYSVQISLVGVYFGGYWTLLFALSLYPSGLFALHYIKNFYLLLGDFRYVTLFKRKSRLLLKLRLSRKELMNDLQEIQASYEPLTENVS